MSEADIKTLVRQRGTIKARLTNFKNFLNCIPTDQELSLNLILEVEIRQSKLEPLLTEFNNIQFQVEMSSEDTTEQQIERETFESSYYSCMARAQAIMRKLPSAVTSEIKPTGETKPVINDDEDCEVKQRKIGVKLPEIKLNKFDGTYSQWLEFRDMYDSMIHKNSNIMDITKFYYLRSYLEGSAALIIKSIEFSAQNYKVAWDLVCERYNNKRLLVGNHIKSLFNVFPVQKEGAFQLRRLVDTFIKNLKSLEILEEPTQHWDTLLIHILCNKLDTETLHEWEKYKSMNPDHQTSKFDDLIKFIRTRADMLETLELRHTKGDRTERPRTMLAQNNDRKNCPVCTVESHALYNCKTFLDMSPKDREAKAKDLDLCANCLHKGHPANKCRYGSCKHCRKKHNTLLHIHSNQDSDQIASGSAVLVCKSLPQGLLSTVVAQVHNTDQHRPVPVRAVLDSGSSVNLVTEHFCKKHNIPTSDAVSPLTCLNSVETTANKVCNLKLSSNYSDFSIEVTCLVIKDITGPWPQSSIDRKRLSLPKGIKLADPAFDHCSHINLLIGNGLFWHLLRPSKIELPVGSLTLFETVFGWVLGGTHSTCDPFCGITQKGAIKEDQSSIQNQLEKFWKIESIDNNSSQYSAEEQACENDFVQNTKRLANGRFVVNIPLKLSPSILGDTYTLAKQRFLSLERKFKMNPDLKETYTKFIHEYIQLGHMSEVRSETSSHSKAGSYFAPHHAVVKPDSTTTKLRVVFDCSAKSTTGYSYNDLQQIGPTIQDDLLSILLRFRQYNIALTSDIEKMYRQVLVNPEQRKLQQILWRDHPHLPLRAYELNTVTYGSAASSFISIRCLKQLALECKDPKLQEIIAKDFYVDDQISGADTVSEAIDLYTNLTNTLNKGCFPLRKWRCNNNEVSDAIQADTADNQDNLHLPPSHNSKVLGLTWDNHADTICFTIQVDSDTQVTKRNILSVISQIFDPLGIVAPAVLEAKIMLQKLWLHKLSWDQQVPDEIRDTWVAFVRTLFNLNKVQVPRHVIIYDQNNVQLHIFTDASESAYGACAYIRSTNGTHTAVHLLCAKGRVAPLKPITMPRMELCAALLGTHLLVKITQSMRVSFDHCCLWTDSAIVLGWLNMQPNKLHTFVRNRIAEIQSTCNNCVWRHVPSQENPADIISRGSIASALVQNSLWWNGPQYLKQSEEHWPKLTSKSQNTENTLPEVKTICLVAQTDKGETFPFHRFSNFKRMQRVFAYMLRFIHNIKKVDKHTGPLTSQELIGSRNGLALLAQKESFPTEYTDLQSGKLISKKSKLLSLNPFISTSDSLLRVGGRLPLSDYKYDKVHPIIISKEHTFTKLLFEHQHKILMHAGPQHVLYSLRETYWPIGGRDLARLVGRQCLLCSRYRGNTVTPIMGNLPKERIHPAFPFELAGVDYAGPIMMADRKGRGSKLVKAYICIFVCFTTKAIHVELVGDMTTANFIAALKRFISRRGKPSDLFCDNGSNFVGAHNEINTVIKSNSNAITDSFSSDSIRFHFMPPQSPHLGGLHEAGVKSVKHHLRRVLGLAHLTFEELSTTLTLIEALLNSRPLTPLSTNPNDFLPLTPGHFLIGRSLVALPESDYTATKTTRLNRYQRIQQLRQHFWTRWQKEYISELQIRTKWKQSQGDITPGCLVVVKDKQLPPMKWLLGRIIKVFPGKKDNISRVAEIQTATGIIKRDFTKICILPLDSVEDNASTSGSMS